MVKCSYEQKPFRREVMRTYGANVTPSPSMETEVGKKINAEFPGTTGSLGCAISEAVECATTHEGYRYVLGSVLSQVLLHQSIIGLETKTACEKYDIKPDMIIGCAGGGSNLGGLISPFMAKSSVAKPTMNSSPLSLRPAPRSQEAFMLTTSATQALFARSLRCTRSAVRSFPPQTTQAVCATTA